jgi:ApaG protein
LAARIKGLIVSQKYHITVSAEAIYQEQHSSVAEDRYAFAYRITIKNTGEQPARLLSRHWVITDATGKVQEVRGMGVVGEHPHLQPGESYTYTSGSALTTPYGTMRGSYQMEADDGHAFDAEIPEFHLIAPRVLH